MKARFVLDAPAVIEFRGAGDSDRALVHRVTTGQAAAPEIIDLEVLSWARKQTRGGHLPGAAAQGVIDDLQQFPIARSPHRPLAPRVRALRHSITPYDASYVALAERLGLPLVTTDAKLAGSNGHKAEIELYPAS
jgi:predicted nucleic acid-binding protein